MFVSKAYFKCVIVLFAFGFGVVGCIDLNDFDKISKNIELEASAPIYESNIYVDAILKRSTPYVKSASSGIYFIENQSLTQVEQLFKFPLNYSIEFADVQLGTFLVFEDRNAFQTGLFDNGFVRTLLRESPSITSVQPNNQVQIERFEVVAGRLQIGVKNDFLQEATVNILYPDIIDIESGRAVSKQYVLSSQQTINDLIDLQGHRVGLDSGTTLYNQLRVDAYIEVIDPQAKGNAQNSIISSLSLVKIENVMFIDTVSSINGSLPDHILLDKSVEIAIPEFDAPEFINDDITILSPVLSFNLESEILAPITFKIENINAHLLGGATTSLPFRNIDNFYQVSVPPAYKGNNNVISSQIIIDNTLISDQILQDVIYNPDLVSLSSAINFTVSPVAASINDELSQSQYSYSYSIFSPLRLDVNNHKIKDVNFENNDIIEELETFFGDATIKVTKIVLAFTILNSTPFDISPQYYLYREGLLIDSLVSYEVGQAATIEGASIDLNGFVVQTADPKTLLIEIDKSRWDRIKNTDAFAGIVTINSVKSEKVPYVYLKNDQLLTIQMKIRKVIFSTEVF